MEKYKWLIFHYMVRYFTISWSSVFKIHVYVKCKELSMKNDMSYFEIITSFLNI